MADNVDPRWAWEPYRPTAKSPWDLRKVGHLYRRAAFGATIAELEAGLKNGPEKTIDALLEVRPQEELNRVSADLAKNIRDTNNGQLLRAWWLYRMLNTNHPLREKFTLFW